MSTRRAPPRAYVTSTHQIDFHIEENKCISFDTIIQFLVSADKIRQKIVDKLKEKSESLMQECPNKDKTITIGLRQTLKAYNSNKLKWIFLDSSTVSPSAVGHVMGLMATNGTKETKFYVIPDLSTTISKSLNLPKVSAIGFGTDCVEHLKGVVRTLHPIDIGLKKKAETVEQPSTSSSSPFILPQLEVPKGKTKLSKKQKKKMNTGKKK